MNAMVFELIAIISSKAKMDDDEWDKTARSQCNMPSGLSPPMENTVLVTSEQPTSLR